MNAFRRILVVRTDRIGDVILTLPMIEVLRQNYPHAHIAMLIRSYTKELVGDNPNLDEILLYDDDNVPLPFFQMTAVLKRRNFDVAFITYPRFRLACLTWWAGIPLRVGTGYRWYSFLFNKRVFVHRKVAERHEAEYNIDLLVAVGCRVSDIPFPRLDIPRRVSDAVRRRVPGFGISLEKPFIIVHPGSGGSAREWSPANFGALGKKLSPDIQVVVTGGKGEETLVRSVAEMIGGSARTVVDQLSLMEYAAFAKLASVLVANSTGPVHIAAAAGTPVIGLYPQVTPMSSARWGPYTDRKTIFVPQGRSTDCRKCLDASDGECECMNTITVEEVFEAVKRYLPSAQFAQRNPVVAR